jgi:membrane fusion protein (multidrug efflux system)
MVKKILLTILILGVVLGPIVGLKFVQISSLIAYGGEMQAAGMPPTPVGSAVAEAQQWENILTSVGSLRPVQGVTLSAELGGKVVEIAVENGAAVKKGDLLVRLDTSSEEAQLASAEANVRLAAVNLERSKDLLAKETVAQAEFDAADATHKQAAAQVANVRALLDKKIIRAPFDGRVGIRMVNVGQTVRDGDVLIPLQALNPIFIDFSIPQQQLGRLAVGQKVRVQVQGVSDPVEGTINAINPQVDAATRNVLVQATLPNAEERLRPGMFASVSVLLPTTDSVVAIPTTAVMRAPYGDSVFVVDQKDGAMVARQQFVRLGASRGDYVTVLDGLRPGDRVVSAGAFKLRNNMPISLNDEMQPAASLTPTPSNS